MLAFLADPRSFSLHVKLVLFFTPAFELRNASGKKLSYERGYPHFFELYLDLIHHLMHRQVGLLKCSILIAMAAIVFIARSIKIRSAALGVFSEGHATALAGIFWFKHTELLEVMGSRAR